MANAEDEIQTLDEVAAYLKAGKCTVYKLAAAKKIPAFKVGGTWRFSRADIDRRGRRMPAPRDGFAPAAVEKPVA